MDFSSSAPRLFGGCLHGVCGAAALCGGAGATQGGDDGGGAVATQFPLAASAPRISRVRFDGDGAFTSLFGEWAEKATGFLLMIR